VEVAVVLMVLLLVDMAEAEEVLVAIEHPQEHLAEVLVLNHPCLLLVDRLIQLLLELAEQVVNFHPILLLLVLQALILCFLQSPQMEAVAVLVHGLLAHLVALVVAVQ
jgi:hypothetical protein